MSNEQEVEFEKMERVLRNSRHRLYHIMDSEDFTHEAIFRTGRLLHELPARNDPSTNTREYFYRKVLDYDPEREVVWVSREGSKNSSENLDKLDREFTIKEIYRQPMGDYILRPMDWDITLY